MWLGHLYQMPPGHLGRCSWDVLPGGDAEEDPGHAGVTFHSAVLGTPLDPPGRAGGNVQGEGSLGVPAQTAASATRPRITRKKMDEWIFQISVLQ